MSTRGHVGIKENGKYTYIYNHHDSYIDGLGITRDLYSNKLKICFEYDGVWHFKDIHGQLESKQKKDYALEKWCKINGYRLIRISESWFTEELKSNINEVVSIIYNTTDQVLKFGKEYN